MKQDVIVLGAGMVGVSTALALCKLGLKVTLIDRREPGKETSYGNAGIIALGSLLPVNNPTLFKGLPGLLLNRSAGFRYSPTYVLKHVSLLTRFLWSGRQSNTPGRVLALHQLIAGSGKLHKSWIKDVGQLQHLRETGWIKLYRNTRQFEQTAYMRRAMEQHDISFQVLDSQAIAELEPGVRSIFPHGLWIKGTSSVDNPALITEVYFRHFLDKGGRFKQLEINNVSQSADQSWQLHTDAKQCEYCRNLVIALGPWSRDFLQTLNIRLPMIYERGGHRHFYPQEKKPINRPLFDAGGDYVVTPMTMGLRLTCGVELNERDAYYKPVQLDLAEGRARQVFPLGERTDLPDWHGSRPTLPDSLPAIGACKRPGLWLNTGHQHIGFSTGPLSGRLLAEMMSGIDTKIDASPFSPSRFGI